RGPRQQRSLRPRRHICFVPYAGWRTVHVRRHQREVGPLSRGVRLPPLSGPLQTGIRLLPPPLPAAPSAGLAVGFPLREDYGLTTFRGGNGVGRSCLWAGGATSAAEKRGASAPGHLPFGPSLTAASGSVTKGPHLACHTLRP